MADNFIKSILNFGNPFEDEVSKDEFREFSRNLDVNKVFIEDNLGKLKSFTFKDREARAEFNGVEYKLSDIAYRQVLQLMKIPLKYFENSPESMQEREIAEGFKILAKKSKTRVRVHTVGDKIYGILPTVFCRQKQGWFVNKIFDKFSDKRLVDVDADLNGMNLVFTEQDDSHSDFQYLYALEYSEVAKKPLKMTMGLLMKDAAGEPFYLFTDKKEVCDFKVSLARFNEVDDWSKMDIAMLTGKARIAEMYDVAQNFKGVSLLEGNQESPVAFDAAFELLLKSRKQRAQVEEKFFEQYTKVEDRSLFGVMAGIAFTANKGSLASIYTGLGNLLNKAVIEDSKDTAMEYSLDSLGERLAE